MRAEEAEAEVGLGPPEETAQTEETEALALLFL